MRLKKYFNFRPFFIVFVFLIIGAFFVPFFYKMPLFFQIFIPAIFALCIGLCFIKNLKKFLKYSICIFAPLIIALSIGSISIVYYESNIFSADDCKIEAVITDQIQDKENGYCTARNVKINGIKISGKIRVYFEENLRDKIEPGNKIIFKTDFTGYDVLQGFKINSMVTSSNIWGMAFANETTTSITQGRANLFETIRLYIKGNLASIKNDDLREMSYAVLFGQKENMPETLSEQFSLAGTAHLLAISGLHVGILIAAVSLILKICKAGRKFKFWFSTSFLVLLCFLCTFSPSVVRASFVAFVYLIAAYLGKERDSLTALSVAGCLILLFNIFQVYNFGFCLSFASVFAILCLANPIATALMKIKFGPKTASILGTILAVNFATIPIAAIFSHTLNYISFISNIFLIPLFTFYYSVLFTLVLITIVFPFLSIILNIIYVPFIVLMFFVKIFASVSPILFNSNAIGCFLIVCATFLLGHFVIATKKEKWLLSIISVILIIVNFTMINISIPPKYELANFERDEVSIITNSEGGVLAVSEKLDKDTLNDIEIKRKKMHLPKIDGLIIYGIFNEHNLNKYASEINYKVLIPLTNDEGIENFFGNKQIILVGENDIHFNGFTLFSIIKDDNVAIGVNTQNLSVAFTMLINKTIQTENIAARFDFDLDILYAKNVSSYIGHDANIKNLITQSLHGFTNNDVILDYGQVATFKNNGKGIEYSYEVRSF